MIAQMVNCCCLVASKSYNKNLVGDGEIIDGYIICCDDMFWTIVHDMFCGRVKQMV